MKRAFDSVRAIGAASASSDALKLTPTQLKVMRGVHSGLLKKQIA